MRTIPRLLALGAASIALVLSGCEDDQGPPPVGSIEARELTASARVAASVSLRIRVEDERGSPMEGLRLSLSVAEDQGSVTPDTATTGPGGEVDVRWTLGSRAGEQALRVTARGASETFRIQADPAPPSRMVVTSGNGQSGTVGDPLPTPVRIRIQDRYGNGVPGRTVTFAPRGDAGRASPATATTDAQGTAFTTWTLGPPARPQWLDVTVERITASVQATAVAAPAAEAVAESGDRQAANSGFPLPQPLVVGVRDPYGNPVPDVPVSWSLLEGTGELAGTSSFTDEEGLAAMGYAAGSAEGEERVVARVEGLEDVVFTALVVGRNLILDGLYLTQSAQRYDGTGPLVAGRDGWIRAFVRAEAANGDRPDVRVRIWHGSSVVETHLLEAGEDSVRVEVAEGALAASWNVFLPGELVQPGLGISAEVDPDDEYEETDESDNSLPAEGGRVIQDVREIPDFQVRMVPIHLEFLDQTGDVTEENVEEWLSETFAMMPMPGYDAHVREPFTGDISTVDEFGHVLSAMLALRTAEGSERYYYGVLPSASGAPFCGLGYLGLPASVGLDACGGRTAAHEWGHNWDRLHAPCGGPGGVDPNYPYPDATLGVWGMEVASGELRHPTQYRDLMSYCNPEWVSDYTFEAVLDYREAEAESSAIRATAQPSLVVWGRIEPEGMVLEPTFEAVTTPSLPDEGGPFRIRGMAADGRTLFELSFAGAAVDHLREGHRHFAFAVPADMAGQDLLERLVLEAPGRAPAVQARSAALVDLADEPEAVREATGQVRITWSQAAAPLVVVRNPATGAILSFARGGSALVATDAGELELEMAGGVGSVTRRVPVR